MTEQSVDERLEALETQTEKLESRIGEISRDRALLIKALRTLVDSDAESGMEDLPADVRSYRDTIDTALKSHAGRLDDFEEQGAGQANARIEKIRRAMIRRAARKGASTVSQAAQTKPISLDYEDVLALFDYEIARGYASELIDKAASTGEEDKVFWVKKGQHRSQRKKLKLDLSDLPTDNRYRRRYEQERARVDSATNDDPCRSATTREEEAEGE